MLIYLALRLLTAHATINVCGTFACTASPQPNANVDLQFTRFGKFSSEEGTRRQHLSSYAPL